jgi:glycosyltransferase involved in cell wall biosynthesis
MSTTKIQKILIISAHFYPLIGGTPTHTKYLCKELENLGKEVVLVTEDTDDDILTEYDAALPYTIHRLRTGKFFRNDTFFPLLVGLRISRYIKEFQPDIINISTGNYVPLGIKLSRKFNIPIVYTVHNVPPEEYTLNISRNPSVNNAVKKVYFRFIRFIVKCCMRYGRYDSIISGSERTKERLLSAGAAESDIRIISYGVALPEQSLGETPNTCRILTVAGIIEHKGQLEVVKSIPAILKKIPNAEFYFVGPVRSPVYLERIRETARSLGVLDKVIIPGEVSSDELGTYYQRCDIYLQPSYQEGFCLALMDAMTYEKPVIGTPVGAIPELIGSDRGILIPSPNPSDISSAVIRLAKNPEMCRTYGENGRTYVEKTYSWRAIVEDTLNFYEETREKSRTENKP